MSFQDEIQKAFAARRATIAQNLGIHGEDPLEKGRKGSGAPIGTIQKMGGRDYIKTATGWKYHGSGKGAKAQGHVSGAKPVEPSAKIKFDPSVKVPDSFKRSSHIEWLLDRDTKLSFPKYSNIKYQEHLKTGLDSRDQSTKDHDAYIDKHDEVKSYFKDNDVPVGRKFELKDLAQQHGLSVSDAHVLLCNLEDVSVMRDIANGKYNSFDPYDSGQFNDSYHDVMSDLGLSDDDEEEEDDDDY